MGANFGKSIEEFAAAYQAGSGRGTSLLDMMKARQQKAATEDYINKLALGDVAKRTEQAQQENAPNLFANQVALAAPQQAQSPQFGSLLGQTSPTILNGRQQTGPSLGVAPAASPYIPELAPISAQSKVEEFANLISRPKALSTLIPGADVEALQAEAQVGDLKSVKLLAKEQKKERQSLALQDAARSYASDPSDENFKKYFEAYNTVSPTGAAGAAISRAEKIKTEAKAGIQSNIEAEREKQKDLGKPSEAAKDLKAIQQILVGKVDSPAKLQALLDDPGSFGLDKKQSAELIRLVGEFQRANPNAQITPQNALIEWFSPRPPQAITSTIPGILSQGLTPEAAAQEAARQAALESSKAKELELIKQKGQQSLFKQKKSPEKTLKIPLITVQAPGQPPRQIYKNKFEGFAKKYPGAQVIGE